MKTFSVICLIAFVPACIVLSTGSDWVVHLTRENGLVETLTVFAFFGCVVFCTPLTRASWPKVLLLLPCLVLSLRELDAHHWFSSTSITKLEFYTSSDISPYVKLLVIFLLVLLLLNLFVLFKRDSQLFLDDLKDRRSYAVFGLSGILLLIGTKVFLDGLSRKFSFVEEASSFSVYMNGLEECFELSGSILILYAVWNFASRRMPERIEQMRTGFV